MKTLLIFLLTFVSTAAFSQDMDGGSGPELNCDRVDIRSKDGEKVYIEFRRTDLYSETAVDTEILAIGSPMNPHANKIGVASFYIEKLSLLENTNKIIESPTSGISYNYEEKVFAVKLSTRDGYLIRKLNLEEDVFYTICKQSRSSEI